jgi:hypothetical protein
MSTAHTSRRALRLPTTLAALATLVGCGNAPPPPPPPTAPFPANLPPAVEALRAKVTARYGNARTYRDKGTGTTSLRSMTPMKLEFDTAFARNGGFRWSFTNDLLPGGLARRSCVVWSVDGRTWNVWAEVTRTTRQFGSLSLALAGPTATSNGLARVVPELLVPSQSRSTLFTGLTAPTVRGKEQLDGIECDVLEGGILGTEGTTTIWIDPKGAIRKYRMVMKVDPSKLPPSKDSPDVSRAPFEAVTEFVFEPEFDVDVSSAETAFKPPS